MLRPCLPSTCDALSFPSPDPCACLVQISLFLPTAMEMVGVSPEHFPNEPHLDAYWKHERVSLAPVMAFWVGVSCAFGSNTVSCTEQVTIHSLAYSHLSSYLHVRWLTIM